MFKIKIVDGIVREKKGERGGSEKERRGGIGERRGGMGSIWGGRRGGGGKGREERN